MKAETTRRLIGGAAAVFGLHWIFGSVYLPLRRLWTDETDASYVYFLLTMVPLMLIPGLIALIHGVRLFREMSESSLRALVGLAAFIVAILLFVGLNHVIPTSFSDRLMSLTFFFVSCLAVIPAYLLVVRWLLRHLADGAELGSPVLSRGVLMLMALQLWMVLTTAFSEYAQTREGYVRVREGPRDSLKWSALNLFVPIVVAYGSYRIAVARWSKVPPAAPDRSLPSSDSP